MCVNNYASSDIKYIVDGWAAEKTLFSDLSNDSTGYSARLITIDELENLGYVLSGNFYSLNNDVPDWIYNNNYYYWTMTPYDNSAAWYVQDNGVVSNGLVFYGEYNRVVRPVITIKKSALSN